MSIEKRKEELSQLEVKPIAELRSNMLDTLQMPSTWKVRTETREHIEEGLHIFGAKHGLYAAIPMMCRGEECPYASVCPLIDAGKDPSGSRCPLEIALILKRYDEYVKKFQVPEDDVVDQGLIKDLVDFDVQLFRADNRMAIQADFVEEVVTGIAENGQEITQMQISKAAEYKDKIQAKKNKVLQLMHSTRSDKAGDKLTVTLDPSTYAAKLMEQVASNMGPGQIFDEDFVPDDDFIPDEE
jgi:hypothetical protein